MVNPSIPAGTPTPISAEELLRAIYVRERPFLQTNNWSALRIPIADLIAELCPPPQPVGPIVDLLRLLRLDGKLMFLPDWERWGTEEDETDGAVVPSRTQWEPTPGFPDPPSWVRRSVFLPDDLKHWSLRSRVAEVTRLLFANRERFGLEAATAHLGYQLQPRYRPNRDNCPLTNVVDRLHAMVDAGRFPAAVDRGALKLAIETVAAALRHPSIAAFQERAWEQILESIFEPQRSFDATMITAGVSSGKTFAFLLPALTLVVYRALCGQKGRNRVLVVYPRTSLVEDQYHGLRRLLEQVNIELATRRPGLTIADRPALDAGQMLAQSLDVDASSLAEVLPEVARMGIELILTTPESLKNRMLDPRAVRTYLQHVEMVVFDEIHLMEGLAGCHGIHFVRRLRHLLRDLHNDPTFEPAWVGASATVAEPVEHCARVLTLNQARVTHVFPTQGELQRFGNFHHVFLHTRVGKASVSAITNGVSALVHSRNDCTPYNHYVDPAAPARVPRPSEEIRKTIGFVDSLSTIGRLRYTIADNEKTREPHDMAPPYYSWFYRPAARLRATRGEETSIGTQRLADLRTWCQKCFHGQPARIDASALKVPELSYLRTGLSMSDTAIARSTPPGFPQVLQQLNGTVGNLDQCPFHQHQLCWWFSQDSGERLTIGAGRVPIDQLRVDAYTSKTDAVDSGLHENVNDYFLTDASTVWERAPSIPDTDEAVSLLLASPRIEVGVDFQNVRDGVTHKAMRSAASFQQKIGRVGREDSSDSMIVTFLARRPTDAHFAHQPARLIDSEHLDPIPLKSENPDVVRNHMFAAALEFIASRVSGTIPNGGHELNIIGTGSNKHPPWEDKVSACLAYVLGTRAPLKGYLLAATGHGAAMTSVADEAIDHVVSLLQLFVVDLTGAYATGGNAARLFKDNQRPLATPGFSQVLSELGSLAESLQRLLLEAPAALQGTLRDLLDEVNAPTPAPTSLGAASNALQMATVAAMSSASPQVLAQVFTAIAASTSVASALGSLTLSAPLATLREVHAIVEAFFEDPAPGTRIRGQFYLHDILTKLLPFRRYYPFGLVRTHFQHVNARQVRILIPGKGSPDGQEYESLSTALSELLPGTWNYRWLMPKKSPCGPVDRIAGTGERFANLSLIERPFGAAFEPTGAVLTPAELPVDMPATSVDVPILRPTRLRIDWAHYEPNARYDNHLIGDDDESPREDDPKKRRACPTLPRAFPAIWFRVAQLDAGVPVVGVADPGHPTMSVPHTFPALGRVLFDSIAFSAALKTDRYVYAIDRSYGSGGIESPRIHYRRGGPTPMPVVLGDTLGRTDGLVFKVRRATSDALLAQVAASGHLRGELTIRAMRSFIAKATGCGPFQAEMLRRVLLMEHLDQGGTLSSLGPSSVVAALGSIGKVRYDQIAAALLDGTFAGTDPAEAANARLRQSGWYEDAWLPFLRVQAVAGDFTAQLVGEVARDVLMHTLAVTAIDALGRLVGASDGDLAYFHRPDRDEFYVFDSVEGGNGCSETIAKFMQIPPLRRTLAARGGAASALPSADGFMLLEEAFAACPAQSATRLLVDTCLRGVADPSHLRFPRGLVADLQARIRHEYDPVSGARAIVEHLLVAQPTLFNGWPDLVWLQLLPERFALALRAANVCANVESLRARTHLCVTGCLECVDNGDQSIYGGMRSGEHVSKNLLEAVRSHVLAAEPQSFLQIPPSAAVGQALQANTARPVLDPSGVPVTALIDEDGTPRQVLFTQVLSTVAPDLSIPGGPLLVPSSAPNTWDVRVPFLAGYRDEGPRP